MYVTPVDAELAEFAMLLEVTARVKPGNVDRGDDYEDTRLDHFLSSATRARFVFEQLDTLNVGEAMYAAVRRTNNHSGGNTHFGAFILLIPLIKGHGIDGANKVIRETTVADAVNFYRAFGETAVRVNKESDMDVNDPASIQRLRDENLTMYDVMSFSAKDDMVAREWINGFKLTREMADVIKNTGGVTHLSEAFATMLARHIDTFVVKKFGIGKAEELRNFAVMVEKKRLSLEMLDAWCLHEGVNPGSLADICIAGLFVALLEGWNWDS